MSSVADQCRRIGLRGDNTPRPFAPEHGEPDIVEGLRTEADNFGGIQAHVGDLFRESANEIERLRKLYADSESRLAACEGDLEQMIAERDALRERIERAPLADAVSSYSISGFQRHYMTVNSRSDLSAIVGKRVRLVVEDE